MQEKRVSQNQLLTTQKRLDNNAQWEDNGAVWGAGCVRGAKIHQIKMGWLHFQEKHEENTQTNL